MCVGSFYDSFVGVVGVVGFGVLSRYFHFLVVQLLCGLDTTCIVQFVMKIL